MPLVPLVSHAFRSSISLSLSHSLSLPLSLTLLQSLIPFPLVFTPLPRLSPCTPRLLVARGSHHRRNLLHSPPPFLLFFLFSLSFTSDNPSITQELLPFPSFPPILHSLHIPFFSLLPLKSLRQNRFAILFILRRLRRQKDDAFD